MDKERRNRLRQVKALEQLVRDALNAEDPLRLLCGGAPANEFDPETELVLGGLVRLGPDEPALTSLVGQVFDKKFWPGAITGAKAASIARRICQGWAHAAAESSP